MFKSLKTKLMISMSLLISAVVIAISYAVVKEQHKIAIEHAQRDIMSLSELIATNTLPAILFNDAQAAEHDEGGGFGYRCRLYV